MQRQFTTFYLGNGLFAIDVLLVQEINRSIDITPVDPSPDFVIGLMNLRGQIVTILDLGIRLGLDSRDHTRDTCCVILKTDRDIEGLSVGYEVEERTSTDIVGLLVDKIGDMVEVDEEKIESPPANVNGVESKYLQGVITQQSQLVAIMNTRCILEQKAGKV